MINRRTFLASAAIWFAGTTSLTRASVIQGHMPWSPFPSSPPEIERPGPWKFFTADEARAMEAIVDRIIPPDPETPGGKDAGCAVFIDRQLKGPYGSAEGLYRQGPFTQGSKEQGPQSPLTPAELYRKQGECGRQILRPAFGRPAGRHAEEARIRRDQVRRRRLRRRRRQGVFQRAVEGRSGGLLLRSGAWRKPRHGGLEDDRLSWHPLRLSRLDHPSQRTLSASARQHRRTG